MLIGGVAALSLVATTHTPEFATINTYFHCVGDDTNKLQNLDYPAPFDEVAPTRSVQDGAGCGLVDPGFLINTQSSGGPADASFSGAVQGNLRDLTVELHYLGNSPEPAVLGTVTVDVWLVIDGITILDPAADTLELTPVASSTGASHKVEFSVTDLPFDTEDGVGDDWHSVQLTVRGGYADSLYGWVWDTTEVPSGITFNPETLADVTTS